MFKDFLDLVEERALLAEANRKLKGDNEKIKEEAEFLHKESEK